MRKQKLTKKEQILANYDMISKEGKTSRQIIEEIRKMMPFVYMTTSDYIRQTLLENGIKI